MSTAWAKALEESDLVMHLPTNALGTVRVRAPGEYVSPLNGMPVTCEVIQFSDGNAFVVREEEGDASSAFVTFGKIEAKFYAQTMSVTHEMIKMLATVARGQGVPGELAATIIGRVLLGQGQALMPPPGQQGAPGPLLEGEVV